MEKSETDFQISRLTLRDLHFIHALQPAEWGDIMPGNRLYQHNLNCYSVKAVKDNRILGIGTAIMHADAAWIANIIVHPDQRRQGIATAVTRAVTQFAQQHCPTVLLIATDLGRPVYEKLGYVADGDYVFFHEGRLALEIPEEIIPFNEAQREGVYRVDRNATGEDRRTFLAPYLHQSWVYCAGGEVQGFFVPLLGEGLTLAETTEAGLALLRLHLLEKKRIVLPAANKAAVRFLQEHGFKADDTRKATYMYLGEKPLWQPQHIYSRLGGNLG